MPDATPRPPLDAETAVHGLIADVAAARAERDEVTADRDHLAAKLAETLAANQRWAETLGDVQQAGRERDAARAVVGQWQARHEQLAVRLDEAGIQLITVHGDLDDARSAFAKLAAHFTQGAQSGWTARVSGTVLRRLCVMAGCEPPSGSDASDETSELEEQARQVIAAEAAAVRQAESERDAHKLRADHYEGLWRAEHGLPPDGAGDLARDRGLAASVRAVIARYRDDQLSAAGAFADIVDAFADTERAGLERNPAAATLEAAVRHFAEAWRELLPDLPDSYACHLTCGEANAAADLFRELGDDGTAEAILAAHMEHDDEEEATTHDDAEAETASVLADPETMAAIAEGLGDGA
jgi:hypothetical protein